MTYLSNIRKSLPDNCLFNKVRVGCGGTTLALESDDAYVVAVPYVALVLNKVNQHPEKYLGVFGGVDEKDIKSYLKLCDYNRISPKIITTYDCLPKVTNIIDAKEYRLLVDEYHILFQQYAFRNDAILGVIKCYEMYKSFTFMTATPVAPSLDRTYILKELQHLPYVEQDWTDDNDYIDVKCNTIICRSILNKTIDIIQAHLSGEIETNAYFFINSIRFVEDIRKRIEIKDSDLRVIYSKNNEKKYSFERGEITDNPKKINFITSTAFEGCDIFDENGVTYIISDKYRQHTLLDISSTIPQIAGRIRDSKYRGQIFHICNTDNSTVLDAYEFEKKMNSFKKECFENLPFLEKIPPSAVDLIQINDNKCPFLIIRDKKIVYDQNLVNLMIYNYEIHNQYSCKASIESSYLNIGADIHISRWMKKLDRLGITTKNKTFKDAINECRDASLRSVEEEEEVIKSWQTKYPFIYDAIRLLGYKKITSLSYVQSKIKNILVNKYSGDSKEKLVIKKINLKNGRWYSCNEIKRKLTQIYQDLEIFDTPKATDISKYFLAEKKQRRVKGLQTNGYVIYCPLYK